MTEKEYIDAINKNTNLDQDSVNIKAQKDLSFHEGYKLGRTDANNAYDELRKRYEKLEASIRGSGASRYEHGLDKLGREVFGLRGKNEQLGKELGDLKKDNLRLRQQLVDEIEENKQDRLAPFLCGRVASIVAWVFAKRWGFM